jgi:hypothetical protein
MPLEDAPSGVWLEDALIVRKSGDHKYDTTLWRIPHDNPDAFHQLQLPSHPSCGPNGLNGYNAPARLPDGRLSYIIDCRAVNENTSHMHLMVLDPLSLESKQFLPYELPSNFLVPQISWNSDMSVGFAFIQNYLNSWVFQVMLEDWQPLDLGSTQVRDIAWSPDDSTVAFLAAPEQGLSGLNLIDALFNVYLMEPDGRKLRPVLKEIYQPGNLVWSPDSRWLFFSGTVFNRTRGIWAYSVINGELVLISERSGGLSGWLPDGRHLLVWHRLETEDPLSEQQAMPTIYDLEALLEGKIP